MSELTCECRDKQTLLKVPTQMQKSLQIEILLRATIPAGICLLSLPALTQSKARHRTTHTSVHALKSLRLTGTYTRIKRSKEEHQSAILEVKRMSGSKIRVHLTALWWGAQSDSPHNGEFETTLALRNRVAVYRNENYHLTLKFARHAAALTESGRNPEFGANVSAAGTYRLTRGKRIHEPDLVKKGL